MTWADFQAAEPWLIPLAPVLALLLVLGAVRLFAPRSYLASGRWPDTL